MQDNAKIESRRKNNVLFNKRENRHKIKTNLKIWIITIVKIIEKLKNMENKY